MTLKLTIVDFGGVEFPRGSARRYTFICADTGLGGILALTPPFRPSGVALLANERVLLARGQLFERVEQMVGLGFKEDRAIHSGSESPLVVLVTGGRGMGKTCALDRVADAYGNRAPRALIDLEEPRYSDARTGSGPPLISIFSDLKWELEQLVRLNRVRLRFPRLSVALLAITIWPANEPQLTREEAVDRLRAASARVERMGPVVSAREGRAGRKGKVGPAPDKSWVNDWVRDVSLDLSDGIPSFPAKVFVKACIRAFAAITLSASKRNVPMIWHENFDPRAPGDGYEALNNLSRDFHVGGSYRERAEKVLIAAFLADLDAEYRGWSGLGRAARPLVMLDNICSAPAGLRFLQLVLGNRADGHRDPLVVVASGPGNAERWQLPRDVGTGSVVNLLRQPGVEENKLRGLDPTHVFELLGQANPRALVTGIDRLIATVTGGLPLGVEALTAAVVQASRSVEGLGLEAGTLLDLPVSDGGGNSPESVSTYLLRMLIPDEHWRDRMTLFSPARDLVAAHQLGAAYLTADQDRLAASEVDERLHANAWGARDGHFVGDPFIRLLLLHQLYLRLDTPTYSQVYSFLRDRYTPEDSDRLQESEHEYLRSCLALGETSRVAWRLHTAFSTTPTDVWLDALLHITTAPYFARPDRRKGVTAGADDRHIDNEIHRSVNRLMHCVWLLSDPLIPFDETMIGFLEDELKFLARELSDEHAADSQLLFAAAQSWPDSFLSGQRPPAPISREKK